jgi:hypothetical protein
MSPFSKDHRGGARVLELFMYVPLIHVCPLLQRPQVGKESWNCLCMSPLYMYVTLVHRPQGWGKNPGILYVCPPSPKTTGVGQESWNCLCMSPFSIDHRGGARGLELFMYAPFSIDHRGGARVLELSMYVPLLQRPLRWDKSPELFIYVPLIHVCHPCP